MGARHTPHRQTGRPIAHLLTLGNASLDTCCRIIANAIRDEWVKGGRGERCKVVYLFVDDEGKAYIIPDTHPSAESWLKQHAGNWWVGSYSGAGKQWRSTAKFVVEIASRVREDLA